MWPQIRVLSCFLRHALEIIWLVKMTIFRGSMLVFIYIYSGGYRVLVEAMSYVERISLAILGEFSG